MNSDRLGNAHPGEILLEEFLKPLGITQYRLAQAIHVPQIRISQIVRGKRSISADTALRLARYFGTSPQFWLSLQASYDLLEVRDATGMEMEAKIRPLQDPASGPPT